MRINTEKEEVKILIGFVGFIILMLILLGVVNNMNKPTNLTGLNCIELNKMMREYITVEEQILVLKIMEMKRCKLE